MLLQDLTPQSATKHKALTPQCLWYLCDAADRVTLTKGRLTAPGGLNSPVLRNHLSQNSGKFQLLEVVAMCDHLGFLGVGPV